MTLLTQIKAAQLQARKSRNTIATSALTTLIGDAEAVGKNAGRETTDLEVVAVTKKFIKNATESLRVADDFHDNDAHDRLTTELEIYNSFLPKQFTREELTSQLKALAVELSVDTPKGKGVLMKTLKERFDGMYDGAMAAAIVTELLS